MTFFNILIFLIFNFNANCILFFESSEKTDYLYFKFFRCKDTQKTTNL